jgi:beta-N-acetylhexosaminidase
MMATIQEKIGLMIQTGFRGFTLDENDPVIVDIGKHHIGWIVLFDYDDVTKTFRRNIKSPEQLKSLTQLLRGHFSHPFTVSIDQEGGIVNRLKPAYGFPETYSHAYLGEMNDVDFTYRHALLIAKTLKENGISLNLAPVLDLALNKENKIIYGKERCFSNDPEKVTDHARAFIRAHRKLEVLTTVKHFPGHGSSTGDTHLGMVDVTGTWSETELIPYRTLIRENMIDMLMTTHVFNRNLDPDYPATLSQRIITGILREQLGYDGVVMTDDLQMRAIKDHFGLEQSIELALNAGADIINVGNNMDYTADICERIVGIMLDLVDRKKISEERIDESFKRIEKLINKEGPSNAQTVP